MWIVCSFVCSCCWIFFLFFFGGGGGKKEQRIYTDSRMSMEKHIS